MAVAALGGREHTGAGAVERRGDRLALRIGALAFVATHLPLLGLLLALAVQRESEVGLVLAVLAATAAGFVALLLGLRRLLRPVGRAGAQLAAYREGRRPVPPLEGGGEAAALTRDVAETLEVASAEREGLRRLAEEDPVTGLLNRRGAERRLEAAAALAARKGWPLAVALVDLDEFKRVNDALGHRAGDVALRRVTDTASATLRGSDWVARWGGDELLVVCWEPLEGAAAALERLRAAVADHAGQPGAVTVSAGVAAVGSDGDWRGALAAADEALYEAKRAGRDRVASQRRGAA